MRRVVYDDRMTLVRSLVALGFALLLAGCGSDGPSADVHMFHDGANRACSVDAHDISATATCDVDPATLVTCAAGTQPCFTVTPDVKTSALQNCGACCDAPNHQTFVQGPTCADIPCATSADCIYSYATCSNGICKEP